MSLPERVFAVLQGCLGFHRWVVENHLVWIAMWGCSIVFLASQRALSVLWGNSLLYLADPFVTCAKQGST
jgi:hypothetical protein